MVSYTLVNKNPHDSFVFSEHNTAVRTDICHTVDFLKSKGIGWRKMAHMWMVDTFFGSLVERIETCYLRVEPEMDCPGCSYLLLPKVVIVSQQVCAIFGPNA